MGASAAATHPPRGGHKRLKMGLTLRPTAIGAKLVFCCFSVLFSQYALLVLDMNLFRSSFAVAPSLSLYVPAPVPPTTAPATAAGVASSSSLVALKPNPGAIPATSPPVVSGRTVAGVVSSSSGPSVSAAPSA